MLFIFTAPVLIRLLWLLNSVVFLHRCLMRTFLLEVPNFKILASVQRNSKPLISFFPTLNIKLNYEGSGSVKLFMAVIKFVLY